jgi:hypothetical protein
MVRNPVYIGRLVFGRLVADVRTVLAGGAAEERKAVVKRFLKGIRIDKANRRAVLQWYRVPEDVRVKLVAVGGAELDRTHPVTATEEEALPLPSSRRSAHRHDGR